MKRSLRLATVGVLLSLSATEVLARELDKVLFVSNRDGNAQVYQMNEDGSGQKALTKGPAENVEPAWSPDGERIAFTSYRDGNAEIYVMNADGTEQERLTNNPYSDTSPAWLPQGGIVFRSNREKWTNFYQMDDDGAHLKQITHSELDKGTPVVSPDGKHIAFVVHGGDKDSSEIYVIATTGEDERNLTGSISKNKKFSPAWSADSQTLVYVESKDLALNIFTIDVNGSNPVKITDTPHTNANPAWSPDGKRLAFVSSREGSRQDMAKGDIYVMNIDGSQVANLTRNTEEDNYPAWSADGRYIFFVSLRDGNAQIYQVQADGSQQKRITHNAGHDVRITPGPDLNEPGFFASVSSSIKQLFIGNGK